MKTVPSYTATIYVGTKEHYEPEAQPFSLGYEYIQKFVDEVGWCVTFTPTEFIYKHGNEPGFIVGIINYPRFPMEKTDIRERTLRLAQGLLELYKQYKVSVVFPDETVMLEAGASNG